MGLAVLVSITAEADEEPPAGASRFASTRMIEAAGRLDRALQAARPLRAVNEDGEPLPIVQARLAVGDPDGLAAGSDEVEPNGALKSPPPPFPEVDRGAKGNPFIGLRPGFEAKRLNGALARAGVDAPDARPRGLDDPRDGDFDPGHTMSPGAAGRRRSAAWAKARARLRRRRDAGPGARIRAQFLVADPERRRAGRGRDRFRQ